MIICSSNRQRGEYKVKSTIFTLVALISILLLTACGGNEDSAKDIKELVNDYSVTNMEGQIASITSHELIVTNSDESQLTYDLPEDEFFVSIAPYLNNTHP